MKQEQGNNYLLVLQPANDGCNKEQQWDLLIWHRDKIPEGDEETCDEE